MGSLAQSFKKERDDAGRGISGKGTNEDKGNQDPDALGAMGKGVWRRGTKP